MGLVKYLRIGVLSGSQLGQFHVGQDRAAAVQDGQAILHFAQNQYAGLHFWPVKKRSLACRYFAVLRKAMQPDLLEAAPGQIQKCRVVLEIMSIKQYLEIRR